MHMFAFFNKGNAKAGLREEEFRGGIWVMLSRFPLFYSSFRVLFGVYFLVIAVRILLLACGIELKMR